MLALLGAAAGGWGSVSGVLQEWSPVLTAVVAGGCLVMALRGFGILSWRRQPAAPRESLVVRWGKRVQVWRAGLGHYRGALLLGVALSILPCALPVIVLGLAAQTGSWFLGAVLMVCLVALTTPVLVACAVAPAWWGRQKGRFSVYLPANLLLITSIWLGLRVAASWGWIPHASIALGDVHIVFW